MQFLCVRKQKQSDSFLNPQVSLRCWYLFSNNSLYLNMCKDRILLFFSQQYHAQRHTFRDGDSQPHALWEDERRHQ